MFISEKLIFVALHKTGTTHILKLLSNILEGTHIGNHNRPDSSMFLENNKFFLGSIRSPWDWYISLWAYGCMGKGEVYSRTTDTYYSRKYQGSLLNPKHLFSYNRWRDRLSFNSFRLLRHKKEWMEVYSNFEDPELFRRWLDMINNPKYFKDFSYNYAISPINSYVGFLTWRYLRLFCKNQDFLFSSKVYSTENIKNFEVNECYIHKFLRNEFLASDLIDTLEQLGIEISSEDKNNLLQEERSNSSLRKRSLEFYYDEKAKNLVATRDFLIIDKFNYKFDQR